MGLKMKVVVLAGVAASAVLALTACTNGSAFGALDRAAAGSDALPTDLPTYAYDDVDEASSRLVGEHDGNSLYLVRGKEADRVCLLVYPNSTEWVLGCGGAPEFGVSGPTGSYTVRADAPAGAPAPEGHSKEIATNVFAAQR